MTTAVLTRPLRLRSGAGAALTAAARLWFLVALVGQWSFLYYLVVFYGPSTLSGNFQAWARNKMVPRGYVPGDRAGNLFFAAHVLLAALVTFGGVLQLVPQLRARALAFHRWNGRVFLLTAAVTAGAGLYMIWLGGRGHGLEGRIASTLNAALIFAFAGLAWRSARAGEVPAHRRWALRTFLVVNGVWFIRVGFMAWAALGHGRGMAPFYRVWQFGCYLLPLGVLELYLRVRDRPTRVARIALAGALFGLTLLMALGSVALYVGILRPLL